MIAYLNLRHNVAERTDAFTAGLQRLGYTVSFEPTMRPAARDILVTWNRIHTGDTIANSFAYEGCPVLVAENASWGNDFNGKRWYTLARDYHNRVDCVRYAGHERWDALGVELLPWRTEGHTVLLPSRGIGPARDAMPLDWLHRTRRKHPKSRTRFHPGRSVETPLKWDLEHAGRVITWGSGAAIKACMWGIPVESHMPQWIGEQSNSDSSRVTMLRRLAWAQFTLKEFEDGTAFAHVLAR